MIWWLMWWAYWLDTSSKGQVIYVDFRKKEVKNGCDDNQE